MNQYSDYHAKMLDYIKLPISIMVLTMIITIALLIVCIKLKYKSMTYVSLIGGTVIILMIYIFSVFPYQIDIQNNSFETYTGVFLIEEYYFVNRGGTYTIIKYGDEETSVRFKVLCDMPTVEDGTQYHGTIVYSKHSRCLIDIDLNET